MNSLTAYDYGFRIYNPAIGRFLSVDPLTDSYPWYTPYQFAGNKPINCIDVDGLEDKEVTHHVEIGLDGKIISVTTHTNIYPEGSVGEKGRGTLVSYIVQTRVKNPNYGKKGHAFEKATYLNQHSSYETFTPDPKNKKMRWGIYMYTVGPGNSPGMGSEGESDEAVDISGIVAAAGVMSTGTIETGGKLFGGLERYIQILENTKKILDVSSGVGVNDELDKYKKKLEEEAKKPPSTTSTNTKPAPSQNNSTPRIEPGNNKPEPVKVYFKKPGDKNYASAEKEKGPGTASRHTADNRKPDTIFYQRN